MSEYRDPRIQAAIEAVDAAKFSLMETVDAVQVQCPHDRVMARRTVGSRNSSRICLRCGLEEQTWPYYEAPGHFLALRCEFVAEGETNLHRLPHGASPYRFVNHGKYTQER